MTDTISQLITITGARGTGKSTLAATYPLRELGDDREKINAALEATAYFDSENSANRIRQQLRENGLKDFGMYVDLQHEFTGLPSDEDLLDRINAGEAPWVSESERNALIGYYKHIINAFSAIPQGKRKVAILDTGEKFESGMAAYVEANKKTFGITSTAYGKLWTEGVYPLYQNFIQGVYGRGVETLILIFHLKNVWEGNRPVPGKVAMAGKKILQQLSSLMLWLVNDSRNEYGEPAGLVLKERMGRMVFDGGRLRMRQMLPPRIPTCDWWNIDRYLKNGYDNTSPDPRETRSNVEEEMISPLLTDAQTALMLADARLEEQQQALAMAQSGLLPTLGGKTEMLTFGDKVGDESTDGGDSPQLSSQSIQTAQTVPTTKAEAIRVWKGMGRPLPVLLRKLGGMDESEIEDKWESLIGEE